MADDKKLKWLLRIGVVGEFLGFLDGLQGWFLVGMKRGYLLTGNIISDKSNLVN